MQSTFPKQYCRYATGFKCNICGHNTAMYDGYTCVVCTPVTYNKCSNCKESETGTCERCLLESKQLLEFEKSQILRGYYWLDKIPYVEVWECRICGHAIIIEPYDTGPIRCYMRLMACELHANICDKLTTGKLEIS
jgi:hypothetical protein